jgi:glycosyltransferase involved in cell wall biosynthesis
MPEVAEDAAILIDPKSKEDLLTAINRILDNKVQRDIMVQRGYERVKMYSWENVSARFFEQL